ncbi:MAG TPA: hypothetical protein VML55_02770 [Planctomycetaceae bacterium]|nr:hypothetical protein [Planctomycetaceae bacterium]
MQEFIDACFRGPTLPASILLIVACVYWVFALLGALDLDLFDLDLDVDVDADAPGHSPADIGFVALRFLNLGRVPLMIWASVFALAFWSASMLIDATRTYAGGGEIALAIARNLGLALVAAKLLTQPLRGKFDVHEPNPAEDLIGRTCVITTTEATDRFGWAQLETGASPLALSVRATDGNLSKGDVAEICGYDAEQRIYLVKAAGNVEARMTNEARIPNDEGR